MKKIQIPNLISFSVSEMTSFSKSYLKKPLTASMCSIDQFASDELIPKRNSICINCAKPKLSKTIKCNKEIRAFNLDHVAYMFLFPIWDKRKQFIYFIIKSKCSSRMFELCQSTNQISRSSIFVCSDKMREKNEQACVYTSSPIENM